MHSEWFACGVGVVFVVAAAVVAACYHIMINMDGTKFMNSLIILQIDLNASPARASLLFCCDHSQRIKYYFDLISLAGKANISRSRRGCDWAGSATDTHVSTSVR